MQHKPVADINLLCAIVREIPGEMNCRLYIFSSLNPSVSCRDDESQGDGIGEREREAGRKGEREK